MPTAVEELSSISQVLSATNHRNKNQHRLAKWWKAFSVLRRNIIKLVLELETLSANDERLGKTKKKTIESREAVERRTEFMVLWVVPKCYLAFSAIVADSQYANLGLMLTGTLARVQKILKSLMKKREDEDADRSLDISGDLSTHEAHDFGEVLKREETQKITADWGGVEDEEVDAQDVSVEAKKSKKKSITMEGLRKHGGSDSTLSKPPKKKKKKKKGDEFDDLFGSL